MPQVEYQCNRCKKIFERIVLRGEEDTLPDCPACKSTDVSRTANAPPLFKGIASFSRLASDRD